MVFGFLLYVKNKQTYNIRYMKYLILFCYHCYTGVSTGSAHHPNTNRITFSKTNVCELIMKALVKHEKIDTVVEAGLFAIMHLIAAQKQPMSVVEEVELVDSSGSIFCAFTAIFCNLSSTVCFPFMFVLSC